MLKIIKERTPETITEYFIDYTYKDDPNAGFRFPANKDGTPDMFNMCAEMQENYDRCQTDESLNGPEFIVDTHTYVSPAVGKCTCGREVVLDCEHGDAVRCECGRWYNLFGQSLKDPKYWEEDYED